MICVRRCYEATIFVARRLVWKKANGLRQYKKITPTPAYLCHVGDTESTGKDPITDTKL